MTHKSPVRVALLGLGAHGRRFARLAPAAGLDIVAVADPFHQGSSLGEVSGESVWDAVTVVPDFDGLGLSRGDVDVVVFAHHADLEELGALEIRCAELGANVVSYIVEGFDPNEFPAGLRERVDAAAKAHGVTILSTGSQDVSWAGFVVQATSQSRDITRVTLQLTIGIDGYPADFVGGIGVGMDRETFEREIGAHVDDASSIGIPTMIAAARKLGFTPTGEIRRTIEPVVRENAVHSTTFDRDIAAGDPVGMHDVAVIPTAEGVDFVVVFDVVGLLPGVEDVWLITVDGDPTVELEQRISVPPDTVDAIVIHRIGDVLEAAPGLVSALDLPPARYRRTVERP